MKLRNKKSGFTLLEIIIVIIIVGVLASLALPRFFNTIEYARSTEALNTIGTIKRGADRCAMAEEAQTGTLDYTGCVAYPDIGTDNPSCSAGYVAGSLFNYVPAFANPIWSVVATRVDPQAACGVVAAPAGGTITFSYDVTSGDTTRTGTGPYSALK
jgi:prepilin-type N-terminal cleavage/methylation domain-containing protein